MTDTPLSFAQEQLWFIDEFHHGLAAHNLAHVIRLRGPLDTAALGRAVAHLVARHEPMRTRLVAGQDGRPAQVIDAPAEVDLRLTDSDEPGLRELAEAAAIDRFRLSRDWPVRFRLVRLTPSEHALLVVAHQTAFDDLSVAVLAGDLAALYRHEVTGEPSGLAELPSRFAGHALAERDQFLSGALDGLAQHWRAVLAGLPTSRFPADRPRPLLASHDGAVESIEAGPPLPADLRALSEQLGATLPIVLLTAVQVLLYRYTGQTDVVVGTVSASRARPELEPLIGYLQNVLPIRTDLSGDPTFAELAGRVRAAASAAHAHQDLPFAKIVDALQVERDLGRFPVFQTGFSLIEQVTGIAAAGVAFSTEAVDVRASRYDLNIVAEDRDGRLWLRATYPPALFDAGTVRRLLGNLEVLLRGAVACPSAAISQLPVLTGAELHRELTEWNDTAAPFPVRCIHQGFQAQAAGTPGAVAATHAGQQVSYGELNRQANQIARRLRGLGVGPEVLVGVCMATSLRRLAALLGIWKAGGGYVPLDPALPADRLSFMIADTDMAVLLADDPALAGLAGGPAGPPTVLSLEESWAEISQLDDADLDGPDPEGAGGSSTGARPSNVAYVIYTSGSTGQPKGVVVEHRHAINFLHGMIGAWHIEPSSSVLQFAAYTFDVSVMDMFMPLLAGAKVVLASPQTLHSPPRLAALMRDAHVTFACLPPAVLSLLTGEYFPDLRTLLSAGEELSSELLRGWQRDGLEIYNGYGPTEAAIGSTFMKLEPSTPLPPPIGRPKPNYQAYVLDEHLNPVPAGVVGELHIGGAGVARGYLNRPALTAQRFIPDPFTHGQRLYKTGDLVRRRPDGTLVFAGRIDHQVKLRGLRIELGEIEAALAAHDAVAQAVVTVTTSPAGDKQLAGYLRPAHGATGLPPAALADLRAHLAGTLPSYMIPAYLISLDHFPLTTNGKIDRAALPQPDASRTAADPVPPRTLLETVLVDLYATVLGTEQVSAADGFFDAGGSSLQAMQLVSRLRAALAVDLEVSAVFLTPTPQQLAALLRDEHGFDDAELGPDGLAGLEAELAAGQSQAGRAG